MVSVRVRFRVRVRYKVRVTDREGRGLRFG